MSGFHRLELHSYFLLNNNQDKKKDVESYIDLQKLHETSKQSKIAKVIPLQWRY